MDNVFCVLKAITKFKALLADRRAATPTVAEEIEEGTFDPAEEKRRAEEIESLLAQRREVLRQRTRVSGSSDDSNRENDTEGDGAGKGHAKDIGDQEPLYLGIGTSSRHAFYLDDDDDADDVVADSPTAVDYNIYDRAYEQAIMDRLRENPTTRPIMYLTKFVKETDHFKSFGNIVDGTISSAAAVREQMRETRDHLYNHFTSPNTTKLAGLVARFGLADPPQDAKPTELSGDKVGEVGEVSAVAAAAEGAAPPPPKNSTSNEGSTVREQMRETREHLHNHFTSPSTAKLAGLAARFGLSDSPQGGKPAELGGGGEVSAVAAAEGAPKNASDEAVATAAADSAADAAPEATASTEKEENSKTQEATSPQASLRQFLGGLTSKKASTPS